MMIWPKTNLRFLLAFLAVVVSTAAFGQKKTYSVAIFLYEGVELLDFAGPGEVFSSSPGFNVYTMSVDGKELVSQRFVTIKPQYSLETAPLPDILVFPGGGSSKTAANKDVLAWVQKRFDAGATLMSVCTGAEILGATGLLDGLTITTFHGFIDALQAKLPTSKVLRDTRFVDNNRIVTTAGVSAGIDGALHVVSRIRGEEVAKATARYMEYDKWDPKAGRIESKDKRIGQLRMEAEGIEKNISAPVTTSGNNSTGPFEGEYLNLAGEFYEKGSFRAASYVLEQALKVYPGSSGASAALAIVYKKLGKPAPASELEIVTMIKGGKVSEAIVQLEKDRKSFPGWTAVSENTINDLAYQVMASKDIPGALKLFVYNTKAFPLSGNAFDSLGECYMNAGNKEEAIRNYKRSLELDPANSNAVKMLSQLENN